MIKRTDILDALTKCVGYDPIHAPTQSPRIMEEAWVDHFALYPALGRDDLMDAVREYYRTPARPWPQPADLSSIARAKQRDAADRAPLPEITQAVPASAEVREKNMAEIRRVMSKLSGRHSLPRDGSNGL